MSPRRIPHPCNTPGCPEVTTGRYCPTHDKAYRTGKDKGRPTKRARGYPPDSVWRELRAQVIERDPVCTECQRAPSTVADHIVSLRVGGTNTLDNLRGLCLSCNSRKAAMLEGAFGNPERGRKRQ